MAGLVPRLAGSAKMVATPPVDSHWSQVPAVSIRFFGVRDLAFFRRSLPQLGSETTGSADRKNSQSIRAFVLQRQVSVSTGLSGVQTEPDSRGLDPAIQVVSSKELMRRDAAIFVGRRRLDGRVKPVHDARGRFQSIPNRSSGALSGPLLTPSSRLFRPDSLQGVTGC